MGRVQRLNELIDIDNESFLKETSMLLNRANKVNRKTKAMRARLVDHNADWLVKKLGSPQSRPFYCKCALYLPWTRVVEFVELALRPTPPNKKGITNRAAYFVRLARNEMDNLGID